jgi:predicted NBD/HSP70 family sugar kinase
LFLLNYGIKPLFYIGDFNRFYEDVMFENESLESFKPDIIYIHTSNRNIINEPNTSDTSAMVKEKLNLEFYRYKDIWEKINDTFKCPIVQNNFEMPLIRLLGNRDIYDVNGKALLDPVQLEVSDRPQPADVVRLVKERLATLPEGMKLPGVIGISVPGSVNAQTGDVQFSSNLGWSNVPLRSLISSETGIPTIVESNMVCLALTEVWSGLARTDTFAYIHVGWRGVGGGLVFNGEMHRGANSCSAEIGHIQVDPHGPPCCCGKNGCVEVMASGSATLARAKARIAENNMQAADRLSWSGLITEALNGNSIAKETLETTARILGKVAASLVLTVDPGALIFGGRVMEAHEIIMPLIRQMIREQTLRDSLEHLELGVATDSHEKSLAGAARMAARSYLISVC